MSAPLRISADGLRDVAAALDAFSKVFRQYDVEIGGHGGIGQIRHLGCDVVFDLQWDDDDGYRIDDRIGT